MTTPSRASAEMEDALERFRRTAMVREWSTLDIDQTIKKAQVAAMRTAHSLAFLLNYSRSLMTECGAGPAWVHEYLDKVP